MLAARPPPPPLGVSIAKHRAPVLQTCGLGRVSSDTIKNFRFEVQTCSWKTVIGASCPPAQHSYRCHVILTEPRGSANQIKRRQTEEQFRLKMAVLLPTNLVSFRWKYEVVRLCTCPPTQRKDCLCATDHVPTRSVTQRSNNERLFNIGVAPPVSCTQWTGAATQCRETSPDKHSQYAQRPFVMVPHSPKRKPQIIVSKSHHKKMLNRGV